MPDCIKNRLNLVADENFLSVDRFRNAIIQQRGGHAILWSEKQYPECFRGQLRRTLKRTSRVSLDSAFGTKW